MMPRYKTRPPAAKNEVGDLGNGRPSDVTIAARDQNGVPGPVTLAVVPGAEAEPVTRDPW